MSRRNDDDLPTKVGAAILGAYLAVAFVITFIIGGLVVFYTPIPLLREWMKTVTLFDVIAGPGSILALLMSVVGIIIGWSVKYKRESDPYLLAVFLGGGLICLGLTVWSILAAHVS